MDPERVLKYLLPEPPRDLSLQTTQAYASLWRLAEEMPGLVLPYHFPQPKWQFLAWLVDTHPLVLHGSPHKEIGVIEPHQANDTRDFSAQSAVYAASDGIWAIFFAILNRAAMPMAIFNSAVRIRMPGESFTPPFYFFSISRGAYDRGPFYDGMIYILPRQGFLPDPMNDYGGVEISVPHWAGTRAVVPLARLPVGPADFPFLDQVRAHDPEGLKARMQADPTGFPWVDEKDSA